jgi:protein involved in polysaccharide export with SLBB domain
MAKGGMDVKIIFTVTPIVLMLLGLLNGCSTARIGEQNTPSTALSPVGNDASGPIVPGNYVIHPNDELSIKFFYNPELNEDVVVRPDGKISLQLVDEIQASGKTPTQLDKELTELYSVELKRPAITVIMRSFGGQQVFVGGEVGKPQAITLTPEMTPLQAVMNAGGFLDTANQKNVMVIRAGTNNQPQTYAVNLNQIADGDSPDMRFQLHPGDVVYIPKTGIAKADVWMDQHIRRFLLFNGFSYSLRR